jgi:hypothetical protein
MPKIFDCFTFFNEFELLEIRLNELKDVVDTFVICESSYTFTGKPKQLLLANNLGALKGFNVKLLAYSPHTPAENAWDNERGQRAYLKVGLDELAIEDNDLVMLTDVDEIPSAEIIRKINPIQIIDLEMETSYYYVNNRTSEVCYAPKLFKSHWLKSFSIDQIRNMNPGYFVANSGNHFSYLGGIERIKDKIESFSHQEFNNEAFNTTEKLEQKLSSNVDLFNRKLDYRTIPLSAVRNCPQYLLDNQERFSHMIKVTLPQLDLPQVTLIAIDCVDPVRAERVLEICKGHCNFGSIKLLTSGYTSSEYAVKISNIGSLKEYTEFILTELYKHIDTEYVMLVQHDGYILDSSKWDPEFLKYDYIGAPWDSRLLDQKVSNNYLVGNGGFSLRSKKLCKLTAKMSHRLLRHEFEDVSICQLNRSYLETFGIKYAPVELARQFSWETESRPPGGTFGFHGKDKL